MSATTKRILKLLIGIGFAVSAVFVIRDAPHELDRAYANGTVPCCHDRAARHEVGGTIMTADRLLVAGMRSAGMKRRREMTLSTRRPHERTRRARGGGPTRRSGIKCYRRPMETA